MDRRLWVLLGGLAAYHLWHLGIEFTDRHRWYRWSRDYCDKVGRPLLRIGMKREYLEPPNGDVTLDIDEQVRVVPGGVQGDERSMTIFWDQQFGVCFNEHTLEHLDSPADVQVAVQECCRVADYAVFLVPDKDSYMGQYFVGHNLLVEPSCCGLVVSPISGTAVAISVPGYKRCGRVFVGSYIGGAPCLK